MPRAVRPEDWPAGRAVRRSYAVHQSGRDVAPGVWRACYVLGKSDRVGVVTIAQYSQGRANWPAKNAQKARSSYSTTAVTFITPRSIICKALAAASERSRTRPLVNGPRSLTMTTTLRWERGSVTRNRVPNGRLRCAAVNLFGSYRSPQAVLPE